MYKTFFRNGAFLLLAAAFSACSSNFLGRSSASYDEDLAKTRVRFEYNQDELLIATPAPETVDTPAPEVKPVSVPSSSATINKQLEEAMNIIHQQNKSVKYMPGYRIQLYVGNTRSEADAAKSYIYRNFPDLTPYVTFSQPTYRVKAGDFISKAEAETVLSSIRLQYSTAVIISDKIEIEKGLLQSRAD